MSKNTKIEWADATWNPLRARDKETGRWGYHCERVGPGCKNCYAAAMNQRNLPTWGTGRDYTVPNRKMVEPYADTNELKAPLSWKKPKSIFVCSMTDLFGEWHTDQMIDLVFAIMVLAGQHRFLVLTKRSRRMRDYTNDPETPQRIMSTLNAIYEEEVGAILWPLPNVVLGVSTENQKAYDERIGDLEQAKAAQRFISYEPALELVQFGTPNVDQVIVGGESGTGARPLDIYWVASTIDQSISANFKVFVKQLGSRPYDGFGVTARKLRLKDRKGGDMAEWPFNLRVREEL